MNKLLDSLVDEAFNAGYYAAKLEWGNLTRQEREHTERLQKKAIDRRNSFWKTLQSWMNKKRQEISFL